jgi:hypothetical protein
MKIHDIIENKLYEDLNLVKFKYSNFKEDPNPKVKVLDFVYPGQKGQKTYGDRKDLLGFNINYFSNKRYARMVSQDCFLLIRVKNIEGLSIFILK